MKVAIFTGTFKENKDGVARREITRQEAVDEARADIMEARKLVHGLMEDGFIKEPPPELVKESIKLAIDSVS